MQAGEIIFMHRDLLQPQNMGVTHKNKSLGWESLAANGVIMEIQLTLVKNPQRTSA